MATDLIASSPPIPQHELHFQNHSAIAVAASPVMSRRSPPSVASDSTSVVSGLAAAGSPPYLTSVNPKPDYVSQDSASRVTTELYKAQKELDSEDEEINVRESEEVEVSEGATQYVNGFLDKLLHDFLSVASSTQLHQLRTAVAKTLRKSLGQDAITFADANLEDLLTTEDDEDEQRPSTRDSNTKWNLEYTWKRSRLRVMMRSEKSDFDIDDDERWVQQEGLLSPGRRFSGNPTAITLQSEIFLAGVLDYVSDSLLNLAIIPASIRMRRGSKKSPQQHSNPKLLVVEESDLEKGVLNSPLDKLWRMWRKSQRPRGIVGSPRHGYSYSNVSSPVTARGDGDGWGDGPYHGTSQDLQTPRGMPGEFIETPAVEYNQREFVPDADDHPEHVLASNIPLPQGQRDVDEIEVPGLAKDPDEYEEELVEEPRRASYFPPAQKAAEAERPTMSRKRSNSAPSPFARDFAPSNNANMSEIPSEPSAAEMAVASAPQDKNTFSLAREEKSMENAPSDGSRLESTGKVVVNPISPESKQDSGYSVGKVAAGVGAAAAAGAAAVGAASMTRDREASSPDPDSDQAGSPKPNRRNREAAVGFGYPNGISLPGQTNTGDTYNHKHTSVASERSERSEPEVPPKDAPSVRSPSEMSKLRAGSPGSETETSEIMSPRDFMSSRNLQYTRNARSDSLPEHPINPLGANKPAPPFRNKLQTSGFDPVRERSPVSPLSASDKGLAGIPESGKVQSHDQERVPTHRKTSAPAGRLSDDLARARGSPKIRQASLQNGDLSHGDSSSVHRKESLRRIAVERNGSLVSLVDENTHKVRAKAPVTSSSITSADDFDSLLNGGETIKMTLSPSSVREVPSAPPSRNGSIDVSAFSKLSGSLSGGSSPKIGNLLHKRQDDEASMKSPSIGSSDKSKRGRSGSEATTKSQNRRSISRPSVRNKSKTRAGYTAREPTVQTDSTRDFADFIRSTGPDREPQTLVPALTNRSSEVVDAQRQSSIGGRSIHGTQGPTDPAPPLPQVSENTGIKYKRSAAPREARGSEPSGNAGLIDFIRTGPNTGKETRPSKDIAPFRYSMDSEDMKSIVETINLDGPQHGRSPPMGEGSLGDNRASVSTMTTYNSHAPLVSGRGGPASDSFSGPAYGSISGPGQTASSAPKSSQPKPKKTPTTTTSDGITRYRNKDPYAIDFSDDDDDDEDEEDTGPRIPQLPRKPLQTQQSLPTTRSPQSQSQSPATSSAPFSHASPTTPPSGLALNGVSYRPPLTTATTASSTALPSTTALPSISSKASSPPTPSTAGIPSASAGPNQIAGPRPVVSTKTASGGVIPRNPNRNRAAADDGMARRKETSTRDLADFFRDSAPPGEPAAPSGKAAAMMGGSAGVAGAGKAAGNSSGGRMTGGRDRLFGGGGAAPSPNIGGGAAQGQKVEEKKGKFWSRKRYLDLP
ncbi:hypothetical protein B9Z65_6701 [Elsinoe australis]|uniref:Uncharacterized protein n=1 Tax=Elsinoe australis TaxID=40998 RepID=A0A2P8ADY7_9PEZI|nr:hypothetical protein B9Z65_6701 [Elsinoe australis]